MTYEAFDTDKDPIGRSADILAAGYKHIFGYSRTDRWSFATTQEFRAAGFKILWLIERGNPTVDRYFTVQQANIDANKFLIAAPQLGVLADDPLVPCADGDLTPGVVVPYQAAIHAAIVEAGYGRQGFGVGIYGSGAVIQACIAAGVAHWGIVTQSGDFSGSKEYRPFAAISQGPAFALLGMDCDHETIQDEDLVWTNMALAGDSGAGLGG